MTNQRCYKAIKDTSFINTVNKMRSTGSPAYVCSIETTGLNSYDNEIICIDVIKCHF